MANLKISQLTELSTSDGTEYTEVIVSPYTPGTNRKILTSKFGITREFNRAFSEALVFDKNEIEYAPHTATGNLNFTVSTPTLLNQFSSITMEIILDGTQSLNFTGVSHIYGITNGQILPAGSYELYFLYSNGKVRVQVPGTSAETSGLTQLIAPANFLVTVGTDPETELDLSWTDVSNEVGYQIEKSLTGTGGWILLSNPVTDATTDTESGLNPGDTIYYRIKAIGDGVTFADSPYSTASGMTQSSGDVTAPVPTFFPANGNAVWTVNRPLTITMDEAIRDDDGVTAVTSANAADYVVLKQTNSGGADITKTVTYDSGTRTFTITPTTTYGTNQLVYLAIDGIEDINGNEMTLQSITFTTTAFTYLDGSSNRLIFGDLLDGVIAANDAVFNLKATVNNLLLSGARTLWAKLSLSDNQRSFIWYTNATDVYFGWYSVGGDTQGRLIKWTGVLVDNNEHDLELQYNGALDTSDGLDRAVLLIDAGTAGSKTLATTFGALGNINNSTAQLSFGVSINSSGTPVGTSFFTEEAKDIIIESAGAVVEINVPIVKTGTDTSGNARHGTWV